jgi:NAD(P)-dependent dehydrogenase (short-subunit alcohol dehydrogenase family)
MADAFSFSGKTERELGEIDIVINNAGILHIGNPEDIPLDEWQRMLDVHPLAAVRSCAVMIPKMLARGHGYIVNTASFAGLYPFAISRVPYAMSKSAVLSLTQNLAIYLLPKGIRVSCLCPGPVMTTSPQGMQTFTQGIPMVGPGSHLTVKLQAEAARILADGMCAGRILILTHDEGLDTLREYARSPDEFIRAMSARYQGGDLGKPSLPPELRPEKRTLPGPQSPV